MANSSRISKEKSRKLAKKKQEKQRQTLIGLGIVSVIAIVAVAILVWVNNRPLQDFTPTEYAAFDGTILGDPNAPITIEVFEDFQCSHCKNFNDNVKPLLYENYLADGKAKLVFRNFPILGERSVQAASAAYCAANQNRFWDYQDILFLYQTADNTVSFSNARLDEFALTLDLDMNAFRSCLTAGDASTTINDDFALGQSMGVNATPTVFINGIKTAGPDFPSIDAELKALIGQ